MCYTRSVDVLAPVVETSLPSKAFSILIFFRPSPRSISNVLSKLYVCLFGPSLDVSPIDLSSSTPKERFPPSLVASY